MKKTKIVATIGPSSGTQEKLTELLKSGMNVMRLNFSHGTFEDHAGYVKNFRAAMEDVGVRAAICQDLSGPKIRIGSFDSETVTLEVDAEFVLTTDEIVGTVDRVHITYEALPREVAVGEVIYLDDGKKKLQVKAIEGNDVVCTVLIGGVIRAGRGVNLPDSDLSVSSLTEKDKKDLVFGLEHKVDFVALSFVRRPEDIEELRALLDAAGSQAKIIAKIETPQAVKHLDAIIQAADATMVARGDLAIEIPAEKVPIVQKEIIRKCNEVGKPVITATQMLESMIHNPVPTRAEVSDIANAILDGTDAIMLSEETALGEYPVEAVKVMARIANEIELEYADQFLAASSEGELMSVSNSITRSVVETAHDIDAKLIVALTETGFTARMLARHKPRSLVLALSHDEVVCRQLALSFGCLPIHVGHYETLEDVFAMVKELCVERELAKKGDKVVIAAGAPFRTQGSTNMMIVETV
jgi:pyruvate kinase